MANFIQVDLRNYSRSVWAGMTKFREACLSRYDRYCKGRARCPPPAMDLLHTPTTTKFCTMITLDGKNLLPGRSRSVLAIFFVWHEVCRASRFP